MAGTTKTKRTTTKGRKARGGRGGFARASLASGRPAAVPKAAAPAADDVEPLEVTSESFEALLLESAAQAAAIARGDAVPSRRYTLERTERDTAVPEPREFSKSEVAALRRQLRVSQGVFARMIGVSAKLAQAWEAGDREPNGPAARMLEMIARQPRAATWLLKPKSAKR